MHYIEATNLEGSMITKNSLKIHKLENQWSEDPKEWSVPLRILFFPTISIDLSTEP